LEEGTESWPLRSGLWNRDIKSGTWLFKGTEVGGTISNALTEQDAARLIGARFDKNKFRWLPPEFAFSPDDGLALPDSAKACAQSWVPPYGSTAIVDLARPASKGLKQTGWSLRLESKSGGGHFDPAVDPQFILPALPPGRYNFLSDRLDVIAGVLIAIDAEKGEIQVLLPETGKWTALNHKSGGILAEYSGSLTGWRMELVRTAEGADLYVPTVSGLAIITPKVLSLTYSVRYVGDSRALGGPVAWAGEVWLPVLGSSGKVNLIGQPNNMAKAIVLDTSAPVPVKGFEAPVFDNRYVIWPCEEGQLIVRLNQDGKEETEWIDWPAGTLPRFNLGSAFLSSTGIFWQACWNENAGRIEYVQMGKKDPERVEVDAPRLGTGYISYKKDQRIKGDPWRDPENVNDGASADAVIPIIETTQDRASVSLKVSAPNGVLELLESSRERHRAVLQIQADNSADVLFGILIVSQPWLTTAFIHDSRLWIYHHDAARVMGWALEGVRG